MLRDFYMMYMEPAVRMGFWIRAHIVLFWNEWRSRSAEPMAPVEKVQRHALRIAEARDEIQRLFPN
jgi:hypothetical protein